MSKTAFIFPGQGSQFVGMARDLYESSGDVRNLYNNAADILGFDLAKICFTGPEDALKQTNVTQPAIFVHSIALSWFVAEKGLAADMVAGHSLGEYTALCHTGALSFEDGLNLVKVRGELMQKAGEIAKGTMAAVLGLDAEHLNRVCQEANSAGVVTVANYNSPTQSVISGSVSGVQRGIEIAKERGAKKVVPLVVGGAFHSPLMEFAVKGLSAQLESVNISNAEIPVYSNVTTDPVVDAGEIKRLLLQQLTKPVRWLHLINAMIADGTDRFYEIGPGTVLTGIVKRINRAINCTPINNLESLTKIPNE